MIGVLCSLEQMDRRKQRQFRASHPFRYHNDTTSEVASARSKSSTLMASARLKELAARATGSLETTSDRSRLSTSQRLKAMSTRASQQAPSEKASRPRGLKAVLNENTLYEDVIHQIN